jgi:colicin import membrane protein
MNATMAGVSGMFEERIDPGRISSFLLAAAVHLLLFAILVFGVRWQNRPPEAVEVELWSEPVPAPVAVEPKPAPAPEPMVVKPEPVIPKPEIVLKETVKAKPAPKPVPKPEPVKPKVDETRKRINQELAREQQSLAIERERQQIREQLARDGVSANSRALETWVGKIQVHIRSRINKNIADAVPGNPATVFIVTLLPNCEVLKISLVKSGGNKAYDEEVERAILKSSPLPRPDKAEIFDRELRLTFRPKDKDQI